MSWIGIESKAISKMIILSAEPLPLEHVADSANLDKIMKSIFNDAMFLEVSCVSHHLMQWFHGSLVEQNDSVDKNHQNINFELVLLSGLIVTNRISGRIYGKLDLPDIRYPAHP